ncbi:DUF1569 domain-containing protein [Dolichospermum sp. ST_sed3]|nr:DUF1569 domain-containing protein [Dolichospermum sp. ST_sed3]
MTTKNLYDPSSLQEMLARIEKITPQSQRQWGTMDISQMLAHCANVFDMAIGKINPRRVLIGRLIGPFFRSFYTNDKPFSKGGPTSNELKIVTPRNFDEEKSRLIAAIKEFAAAGEAGCSRHPHPFFGELTPAEWSRGMYKHLDHHLQQFGG